MAEDFPAAVAAASAAVAALAKRVASRAVEFIVSKRRRPTKLLEFVILCFAVQAGRDLCKEHAYAFMAEP